MKNSFSVPFDVLLDRCTHIFPSEMESDNAEWTATRDQALVRYVNAQCRAQSTTPSRLMPDELLLQSKDDLASEDFHPLEGKPQ